MDFLTLIDNGVTMSERVITAALLLVALIHLLPIGGAFSAPKLSSLYGVVIDDPNLEILMRHRAVVFGLLALLFAYAAFNPATQPLAFFIGLVSVLSFFFLSYSVGGFNHAIKQVIIADVIALVALLIAITLYIKIVTAE